jgi:hypothetical protein
MTAADLIKCPTEAEIRAEIRAEPAGRQLDTWVAVLTY